MSVTETSRDAYYTLTKMGYKQRLVYNQVKEMESNAASIEQLPSNAEVAYQLGWPINAVTPRALELKKGGWLKVAGTKKDMFTKRTVQVICTANPNDKALSDMFKEPHAVSWLHDE